MKVYIVIKPEDKFCVIGEIIGVYATEEVAKDVAARRQQRYGYVYRVEEYEVEVNVV